MKFAVRSRPTPDLPGVQGPVRLQRKSRLLTGLSAGDVVVTDRSDIDRADAQGLVDAGVVAVVHTAGFISGRHPTSGTRMLLDAGIVVLDGVGQEVYGQVRPGATVRLHDAALHVGDDIVATGRVVDADVCAQEQDAAKQGMTSQLQSFVHNSVAFMQREEGVLVRDQGIPRPATTVASRPVLVVVPSHDWRSEMKSLKPFIREQAPVVVAVGAAADGLSDLGIRADIVVLDLSDTDLPRAKTLKRAKDVVAVVDRGASTSLTEPLERIGVRASRFETSATAEDAALIIAGAEGASLIVGAGMNATLEDFLDQGRSGLASTFLTRLKVGPTLVDARAVPQLYDGAVRPRHLLLALVAGIACLAAAIGVTPVGQELIAEVGPLTDTAIDNVRGLFQ